MKRIFYLATILTIATALAQEPDNTKVNKRDDVKGAVTAGTQSNSKADLDIKVISRDGAVTLRGPVKSNEEKLAIKMIAKGVAGDFKVDSQLEIAPRK